jgi:hypothetical protein
MANFKTNTGQAYPQTSYDKITEHDPMIVKVPLDNVEWGSRKPTMAKARNSDGYKENKMHVKHVGDSKRGV